VVSAVCVVCRAVLPHSTLPDFYIASLPSLVRFCRAFPPLCDDIISLLLQLGHNVHAHLSTVNSSCVGRSLLVFYLHLHIVCWRRMLFMGFSSPISFPSHLSAFSFASIPTSLCITSIPSPSVPTSIRPIPCRRPIPDTIERSYTDTDTGLYIFFVPIMRFCYGHRCVQVIYLCWVYAHKYGIDLKL